MQIKEIIEIFLKPCFCQIHAKLDFNLLSVSLPFNPIKLFLLILWVYLCLYFIQLLQFSPLLPQKYRTVSYAITLIAGPVFWLILLIVDTAKKSAQTNKNVFELFKQFVTQAIETIKTKTLTRSRHSSDIKLFDSSGRNFDEIYGHSDNRKQDNKILGLTEKIIAHAIDKRASDILIDPKDETSYTIRLRIDGILRTVKELKSDICKAIVNSIKAISSMDISEKRRPQDGAFIAKKDDKTTSFRVASAGVVNGEKLSIRILNQDASSLTLHDIGLTKNQYSTISESLNMPSGMILLCGPTGSGKTTTLYAMLNAIDRFTHNVITVEDPIEAVLPSTSQIEINPKADITFAKSLRSILRQDPDVICVGEIRDEETAEIALRAAQTGHLVLATIHSDSNKSALVRLLDLGISPILLSSGLSLLATQRLLRKLCIHCKILVEPNEKIIREFKKIGLDYSHIYKANGCRHCDETGYYGRTAACDILQIDEQLKNEIRNFESVSNVNTENKIKISSKLRKEALKKVAVGITSLEEFKRVIG